ncbi:MAG: EamA-like transporter family protein [Chloroflexi bacterium OLB15]|nr:MAG: EamA-like transporter family protein [Chloroflexi bacterium OLB15]
MTRLQALTSPHSRGIAAALLTPLMLGLAPIFGKMAMFAGADPFSVAAIRTVIAAGLLWAVYGLFFRRYIYIYPAGLLGCVVVGAVNGVGSLFFYAGLGRLDASVVQLLNGTYLIFAVILAHISGERPDMRTLVRVGVAFMGLVMITGFGSAPLDWLGIGLMLGSALMFAGTVILSQYVLYEMPSQTAALYVITTMAVVVVVVWAGVGTPLAPGVIDLALAPLILLGVSTALSRLFMFTSIQAFGSLRTAIIAILEIVVALALAFVVLGDRLTPIQTFGAALLILSLLLVRSKDVKPRNMNLNMLLVHDMSGLQFQRIAFHRAFGSPEQDNEFGIMSQITTAELQAIQRMMGAEDGPVNPFPISRVPTGNTVISPDEMAAFLARDDE